MEPDREDLDRAIRDHGEVEDAGRRVIASWVGHAAVREGIPKFRQRAEASVRPIARHLVDQIQVSRFILRVLTLVPTYADFSTEPDPFAVWELTDAEREASLTVAAEFSVLLSELAYQLRAEGVPLDPDGPENLYALGQLLLLQIDFELPAEELVNLLNCGPSGTISRNGRALELSDHVGRSEGAVWQRIRVRQRQHEGGTFIRSPYARGTSRRTPNADRRRAALATVLSAYPGATVGELLASWSSSERTCGGLFRTLMKKRQDEPAPSRTTISRDLWELRRAGTASAQD